MKPIVDAALAIGESEIERLEARVKVLEHENREWRESYKRIQAVLAHEREQKMKLLSKPA